MEIDLKKQATYFKAILRGLPRGKETADPNRLTLVHFAISALAVLGELSQEDKDRCVAWVMGLQRQTDDGLWGGWRGGTFAGNSFQEDGCLGALDLSHVVMTYSALLLLRLCGKPEKKEENNNSNENESVSASSSSANNKQNSDVFALVDREGVRKMLQAVQRSDGSFQCHPGESESDLRFFYAAAAICYLLDDFSLIDVDRAVAHVLSCQNYDGGFGMAPWHESHGGAMYCAIAGLALLGQLARVKDRKGLERWGVMRQVSGFQGRPGKDADTCYSYWIGAALAVLGAEDKINVEATFAFTSLCNKMFGIAKNPQAEADPLHSYTALCGLALLHRTDMGMARFDPALGCVAI